LDKAERSESQTRRELINPMLEKAGWNLGDGLSRQRLVSNDDPITIMFD